MADEPQNSQNSEGAPNSSASQPDSGTQIAPADALAKTDDELAAEAADNPNADKPVNDAIDDTKRPGGFKAFIKRVNVYLLGFILIMIVVGIVGAVSFLNSQKAPKTPAIATQQLTPDTLKKLATSSVSVGNAAQTLTVQGNAIFSGQVLVRSDLNVAGAIQLGGALLAPSLTVSGKTNLTDTQINSLQVATNTAVQGSATISKDLNVAGNTSLSGVVTASTITVSQLILTGNASLQVPNHIGFPGASPGRSANQTTLGAGGSASINGSDTTGTININTGNNPVAGCYITLTFNRPYSNPPHVLISPVNQGAGMLQYYVNRSNTGFSVCSVNAAGAGQAFAFDYFITN